MPQAVAYVFTYAAQQALVYAGVNAVIAAAATLVVSPAIGDCARRGAARRHKEQG